MEKINFERRKNELIKQSSIKWKKLGFAMLPTSILEDQRLSRSCLVIYWVLITHLFRGKEYCFPSITTLEKESHSSRPTVIKAIKQLKEFGYLEIEKVGRLNHYYLKITR